MSSTDDEFVVLKADANDNATTECLSDSAKITAVKSTRRHRSLIKTEPVSDTGYPADTLHCDPPTAANIASSQSSDADIYPICIKPEPMDHCYPADVSILAAAAAVNPAVEDDNSLPEFSYHFKPETEESELSGRQLPVLSDRSVVTTMSMDEDSLPEFFYCVPGKAKQAADPYNLSGSSEGSSCCSSAGFFEARNAKRSFEPTENDGAKNKRRNNSRDEGRLHDADSKNLQSPLTGDKPAACASNTVADLTCDIDLLCQVSESKLSLSLFEDGTHVRAFQDSERIPTSGNGDATFSIGAGDFSDSSAVPRLAESAESRTVYFVDVTSVDAADVLELYVEDRKRGGGEFERFVRDPATNSVMVIFKDIKVAHHFLNAGTIDLEGKEVRIVKSLPLPVPAQEPLQEMEQEDGPDSASRESATIKVTWSGDKISESTLKMYLSNRKRSGGGPVSDIKFSASDCKAYITFTDPESAQSILSRTSHQLVGIPLHVSLVEPDKPATRGVAESGDVISDVEYSCAIEVRNLGTGASREILSMFFENRKRSGGGPVEDILYDAGECQAIITFQSPEVVERIIQKHVSKPLELCNCRLDIIPLLPRSESDLPSAYIPDSEVDPTRLLLFGLPDTVCTDDIRQYLDLHVSMFGSSVDFVKPGIISVVYSTRPGAALVEFTDRYDFCILRQLTRLKPFKGVMISICKVAQTDWLQVNNIGNLAEDHLVLYFESCGNTEVQDIKMHDEFALVQLSERSAILDLLCCEHMVESHRLELLPYYDCLGPLPTTSASEPTWTPPDVLMTFDPRIVQFASSCHSLLSQLDADLGSVTPNCAVVWPGPSTSDQSNTVKLHFDKATKPELVKSCEAFVANAMGGIEVDKFTVLQEVWKDFIRRMEMMTLSTDNDISVQIDKEHCCVQVVGLRAQCKQIVTDLCGIKATLEDALQRAKTRITDNVGDLKPIQQELVRKCGLLESRPGDQVEIEKRGGKIYLSGMPAEVIAHKMKIFEMLAAAINDPVHVDDFILKLLKKKPFQEYLDSCLVENDVKLVAWELRSMDVIVIGVDRSQVDAAVSVIRAAFLCKTIDLDKAELCAFRLPAWKELQTALAKDHPTLEMDEGEQSLVIRCAAKVADLALERIQNFISEHAVRDEFVSAPNVGTVTALSRYLKTDVDMICSDFSSCAVSIKVSVDDITGPGFTVSGTIHGTKHAAQRLRTLMSKVMHREKTIDRPGMPQFITSSRGRKAVDAIEVRHRAIVREIMDETGRKMSKKRDMSGDGIKLEIKVGKKFVVKIVMGDITEYNVDAIVNAANCSLDHAGGVARSIVDKGGSEIQAECNEYIKANGMLKPAEFYISKPGRLPCKSIIHAVGPIWSNGQKNEKNVLFDTVFNVLDVANQKGFVTVALPAISTGLYRFPLSKASVAILEAVRDFCRPMLLKKTVLHEVHIIDQSPRVVSQFVETASAVFNDVSNAHVINIVPDDEATTSSAAAAAVATTSRIITRSKSHSGEHFTKSRSLSSTSMDTALPSVPKVHSDWRSQSSASLSESLLFTTMPSRPGPVVNGNVFQTPEGVKVTLVKGSIDQQQVDVIVNTTSRDLKLSNGAISRLILQTAGPQIQVECLQVAPQGVTFGAVVETQGYGLQCTSVYHGACQNWDNGAGGCEKTLRAFLCEVFNRAVTSGSVQSIAIPAIGTGNLKIPPSMVASWMYDEVEQLSRKSPNMLLKDIRFVVYDRDQPTISAFETELRSRSGVKKRPLGRMLRSGSAASGGGLVDDDLRSISRISGQWTVKLGSVTLSAKQGDITRESTDAIVNSSSRALMLENGAVSKAILSAAGPTIADECQRFIDLNLWKSKDVCVTSAGKLPCRHIFHVAGEHGVQRSVKACLMEADKMGLTSITFPLLGTGNQRHSASDMAPVMLDCISKFIEKNEQTSLALIQIVIFESVMLESFGQALADKVKGNQSIFARAKEFLGFSSGSKFDVIETPSVSELPPVKQQNSIRLRLSALSNDDLDNVVRDLDDLCTDVVREHVLDSAKYGETIEKLTDEQVAKIQALENDFPVKIDVRTGRKEIHIEGQSESITSVLDAIYVIFREVDSMERNKVEAELISKQVQWMYQGGDSYEAYPAEINIIIEKAYQSKIAKAVWEENDGRYELDFIRLVEEKVGDSSSAVKVKRSGTDSLQLPKTWDPMSPSESFKQVVLTPSSQEYQDVECNVMLTANSTVRQIVSIVRIQNPALYQQYMVRKDSMQRSQTPATAAAAAAAPLAVPGTSGYTVGTQMERILWHGTSSDTLESINLTGFNRSYCGKNAVAYGRGVYFAQQFNYSAGNTYAVPDVSGNKHVYQSRVLTGEFTVGHQSYVVPPQKPGLTGAANRFDSVVDNPQAPGVFVIFSDTQAYPEYLVIFK